jgi:hypothetical protein
VQTFLFLGWQSRNTRLLIGKKAMGHFQQQGALEKYGKI